MEVLFAPLFLQLKIIVQFLVPVSLFHERILVCNFQLPIQARLEAQQGHEHAQHAVLARLKKEQEKSQSKSPKTSKEQVIPSASSTQTSASSPKTPLVMGRRRSFGKAHTPPEVRRSNLPRENGGSNDAGKKCEQRTNLSDDVVTDAVIDGSPVRERKLVKTPNSSQLPDADRKISAPAQLGQSAAKKPSKQNFSAQHDDEHPLSSIVNVTQDRSQTPPPLPSKSDKTSVVVSTQQNLAMSPLAKSASDPSLAAIDGNKHETVSKRNSHEDENWYLPGIPRLVNVITQFISQNSKSCWNI